MVVGAGPAALPTKKALLAAKKASNAPALGSHKGVDPAATTVSKTGTKTADGKPDKAQYDKEQAALKKQIDALTIKLNEAKAKVSNASGKGPNQEKRNTLKAELDSLRDEQARAKSSRQKGMDQIKAMQENVTRKAKEMQAAKSKLPYKTVQEVDNKISRLETQVNSGTMKLVEEKKALMEISQLKKTKKTIEAFEPQQTAIDEERANIDTLRATLEDPKAKAASDRFNQIKAQLDELNKEQDEISKSRDALYEARNAISAELDGVWTKKKESTQAFRTANDRYYQKKDEERARKLEREKSERIAEENAKRLEINRQLLEEAQAPAYERELEECKTLIIDFQKRIGVEVTESLTSTSLGTKTNIISGVKALEIRQIDSALPEGSVPLKKKNEIEENYFVGGGKKNKKGRKQATEEKKEDDKLNISFQTMSALMSLGIAAPLSVADIPTTIEALQLKKKYFVDNQERVTKERIADAEKKIAQAEAKINAASSNGNGTTAAATEDSPVLEATA